MRLLVISNRLPVTLTEKDGRISFTESVGGLATGLSAFLHSTNQESGTVQEHLWIGWPGASIPDAIKPRVREATSVYHSYPVFLTEGEMDNFYHGFCNKTIWALFHYFPSYAVYKKQYWQDYIHVNETFCKAIVEVVQPGDTIWIHDYHLMLLPGMLRARLPDHPIGFFLHIPFPAFEIFRLLPRKWRTAILEGLLGADLIGFHTQDYVQYFLRCVSRLLGYDHRLGIINMPDRAVKADTFPMGIDFTKFYEAAADPAIQKESKALKKRFEDSQVILSIDRLDYSKGIINRLYGYEDFLEKNPHMHGRVALLLIVVPSRIGVEHYQKMKNGIEETVGRLNGKFASMSWTPIVYQYRSLPFSKVVSLYTASDVILVTPLRDGMNLVAKEYIASRHDQTGVLILSEMAGASKELAEAIIVNPNNIEEISDAIKMAVKMPVEDQIRRNQFMQTRLQRYDVVRWANEFLNSLFLMIERRKSAAEKAILFQDQVQKGFKNAKHRLLLLDYDGTLVGFASMPQMAKPPDHLLKLIEMLSQIPGTDVILISGRDKQTMENWFGFLNISLIAEHGAWVKERKSEWRLFKSMSDEWKPHIMNILTLYVDRLPGSFVEEKDFSLAYHYREADPDEGFVRAKELTDNLIHSTRNVDVQILQGNKVIEIRSTGTSKGTAASFFLSKGKYDFILAIGDDWTDEDMFQVLPEWAYSIKVGKGASIANFELRSHENVLLLLQNFLNGDRRL